MRYEKGNFVTVPNKKVLDQLSATAQALFVWICCYADTDGVCFPSRGTLAKNLNTSDRTVDTYIKELEDKGFIQKTNRYHENEKISNEYQILIIEVGSEKYSLGSEKNDPTPSEKSSHRTKSNITKSILSEQSSQNDIRVVKDDEEKPKKKAPQVALEVFTVFSEVIGKNPLNWRTNVTQRTCAENLYKERGLNGIRRALEFYIEHRGDKFCPKIHSPYDLDSKWSKLYEFKESKE